MKEIGIAELPSLKQLVYDRLQRMIIHGEYKPGARLTEDDLSQTMSISRAPIREALNMLERDGFVKIIPRKGAIVAEVSIKDGIDIWNCRMALEPFAAQEACNSIPQEEVQTTLLHIKELEENYTFEKYIASDLEVHELYYKHLDNSYMRSILDNLKAHSIRMRWLQEREKPDVKTALQSICEHRAIVEALLKRDEDAVYTAVEKHIRNAAIRMFGENIRIKGK